MSKDYYQILGVSKNATEADIKSAFRRLAHQHHPDKGGDQKKFKELNEAYQVLSDPKKRAQYDQFGQVFENGMPGGGGAGPFGGGPFSGGFQVNMDDFGDMFEGMGLGDMFGGRRGGRARTRAERGQDIEMNITVEFSEAIFGVEKGFELYKTVTCPHCQGNGAEPGTPIKTCSTCDGRGETVHTQRTILGNFQTRVTCPACHGEGKRPEKNCRECAGVGVVKRSQTIKVNIPAGIDHGETLRLSGHGEAARYGGGAGDLYVAVRVKPDSRFRREGQTIYSSINISISEAVLGVVKTVETLDGPGELKISHGTQSGTKLRLKGKGVPALNKGDRGDHLVEVVVKIPEKISRQAKKLFEDLQGEGL